MKTPIKAGEAVSNIAVDIVLTILTCGIYGFFWQARIFRVVNAFLDEEKYTFPLWALLSLITCGIYNIFIQYALSKSINEIQARRRRKVDENLPVINLVFSIFTFHLLSNGINQMEINAWFE